jgi:hypothetical protein
MWNIAKEHKLNIRNSIPVKGRAKSTYAFFLLNTTPRWRIGGVQV